MNTRILLATASALLLSTQALAATPPVRVRGTISAVNGNDLVVAERDGSTATISLDGETKYAGVVKADLSDIGKGDFIGTATKGPKNFMVALEVTIFPSSMKGMGEGQYPWDKLPDDTANGSGDTSSTMTNGSITNEKKVHSKTDSTMTNGTVSSSSDQQTRTITVSYNGKDQKVIVPPTAQVVKLQAGEKSLAVKDAKVFILATGTPDHMTAKFVAVGQDGVTPPM